MCLRQSNRHSCYLASKQLAEDLDISSIKESPFATKFYNEQKKQQERQDKLISETEILGREKEEEAIEPYLEHSEYYDPKLHNTRPLRSTTYGGNTWVLSEESFQFEYDPKRWIDTKFRIQDHSQKTKAKCQVWTDRDSRIYEPPGILHIGQDGEYPEGNCQEYHSALGERPCAFQMECNKLEDMRAEQTKKDHKTFPRNLRRRVDSKKDLNIRKSSKDKNKTRPTKALQGGL